MPNDQDDESHQYQTGTDCHQIQEIEVARILAMHSRFKNFVRSWKQDFANHTIEAVNHFLRSMIAEDGCRLTKATGNYLIRYLFLPVLLPVTLVFCKTMRRQSECLSFTVAPSEAVAILKARMLAELLSANADVPQALEFAVIQCENGSWRNISYHDAGRAKWSPGEHLIRLQVLARAWRDTNASMSDRLCLEHSIQKGFDFWIRRRPRSQNWWFERIAEPAAINRIILLAEPLFTSRQLKEGILILSCPQIGMTGQNLVWLAENVLGRALWTSDQVLMARCFRAVEEQLRVTSAEGIQEDFSYHQHGAQFYSGGCGADFVKDVVRLAELAGETSFSFPCHRIHVIEALLLDGQQWMIRGPVFDYSSLGREITRPGYRSSGQYKEIVSSILKMPCITRRPELERFILRLKTGRPVFIGHKHFWRADYTVHHSVPWMVSVRLTSNRLIQTEYVNGENLLGEHLADGVMFIHRHGDEYKTIFPVLDWSRLPGMTVEHDRPIRPPSNARYGERAFAGGCSDGRLGVTAMDFERDGLLARKSWFFFDDEIVCLGAGINAKSGYHVITSVNQCAARGKPQLRAGGDGSGWVLHDGIAYIFGSEWARVRFMFCQQNGSWAKVSTAQSASPVSQQVFSLWIDHGTNPQNATYAYRIVPAIDILNWDAAAPRAAVAILSNTPSVQAAECDGVFHAAFYNPSGTQSSTFGEVRVDVPCLVVLRKVNDAIMIWASNPSNFEVNLTLHVNGARMRLALPAGSPVSARLERAH
jgi:chondroitin AC lyase